MKFAQALSVLLIGAAMLFSPLLFPPLPLLAQPATPLPETELYTRKHISFYLTEPDFPLNQVLIRQFTGKMPRFDYHLINTEMGENVQAFLAQVQRHQREKAGELAAAERKVFDSPEEGQLKIGEQIVTWSETQAIAKAAFVFGSHWHFSPVYLTGPTLHRIEENEKGQFQLPDLPGNAYSQIRTVKKKKYNKKTKKDEEVEVREFLYWEVGAGTDLSFQLGIYALDTEPAQHRFNWRDHWYIGNDYVVTHQDMAAARRLAPESASFDPQNKSDQAYLLQIPRFQALLAVEPAAAYMDQAVTEIQTHTTWFSNLSTRLKQEEAFKLKSEVVELYAAQDRTRSSFGEKESAFSLGSQTRDWLEQVEWVEVDGVMQKKSLGLVRIRGFYQDDLLVQPVFVPRNLELGDVLQEKTDSGHTHFATSGGYYTFPGQLSGPSLNLDLSWATETLSPEDFQQRIRERLAQNSNQTPLQAALEEATGWEWNYLIGLTFPANLAPGPLSGKFLLDLHLGLSLQRYERQWRYSLELAPMLLLSSQSKPKPPSDSSETTQELENRAEAVGLKFLGGIGYAFGPSFSLGLQGGLMLAAPYGLGGEGRLQLFF